MLEHQNEKLAIYSDVSITTQNLVWRGIPYTLTIQDLGKVNEHQTQMEVMVSLDGSFWLKTKIDTTESCWGVETPISVVYWEWLHHALRRLEIIRAFKIV